MFAKWNGKIIAESNDTIELEGNHYFPSESVKKEYLVKSDYTTVCHWKGTASYFDVVVDGKINNNAAWYYAQPSEKAAQIKDHIAFWSGVEVFV